MSASAWARTALRWLAAPVAVTVGLPLAFQAWSPWTATTGNLLPDVTQAARADNDGWHGRGARARVIDGAGRDGGPALRVESDGRIRGRVWYRVDDPARHDALILAGWYRAERIEPGARGWQTGRLIAFFRDPDGRPRWDGSHFACASTGTHGWRRCRGTFPVPEQAGSVEVVVQNAGLAGAFVVDDVELRGARRRRGVALVHGTLAALWLAAFGVPLARARPWRRRWGVALVVLAVLIVVGAIVPPRTFLDAASLPETMAERVTRPAPAGAADLPAPQAAPERSAGRTTPAPSGPTAAPEQAAPAPDLGQRVRETARALSGTLRSQVIELKKLGHAALFAALSLMALACANAGRPRIPAAVVLAAVLVFAAGTEALQFLSIGRQPALRDLLIDAAGAVVGIGTGLLLRLAVGPAEGTPPVPGA
ncbi:MAG: hypothetical protein Kow0062_02220 [Acidobacteriota bacterium]